MEKSKIKVIVGSVREKRFAMQPAEWIASEAKKLSEFEVEILDLKDYPMPFFEEPVTPSYKTAPYTHPVVAEWTKKIAEADGFIIVTAEYNHGYTAVLKNALDYVYAEWHRKPVAFVGYGSVGGARAVEQLRQVAIELHMAPIRDAVHIVEYWNMLDEQGKLKTEALVKPATTMLEQLMWWTKALKLARRS